MPDIDAPDASPRPYQRHILALLLVGVVAIAILVLTRMEADRLSFMWRFLDSESIDAAAAYVHSFGVWAPVISVGLMVLQSVIAPLPGSLVAGANGVLYGPLWGTLLSWVGGMAGAMASFGIARYFGHHLEAIWRQPRYLTHVDHLSERYGFWIVLIARLTPILSLDFIGYLAGLSHMRFDRYMLANAIGIIPGMFAYTLLGHDLASARFSVWRISLILGAGIVLLLLGRRWLRRYGFTFDRSVQESDRA
jgi:uncharacterized membrane protein YdjX (TVP38/TMEM64 family)